jgi:hypothetical protein
MRTFEDSRTPVWIVSPATRKVQHVNSAALTFSGYTYSEFIGKPLEELFTEAGANAILRHCIPPNNSPSCVDAYSAGILPLVTKEGARKEVKIFCKVATASEAYLLLLARPLL